MNRTLIYMKPREKYRLKLKARRMGLSLSQLLIQSAFNQSENIHFDITNNRSTEEYENEKH